MGRISARRLIFSKADTRVSRSKVVPLTSLLTTIKSELVRDWQCWRNDTLVSKDFIALACDEMLNMFANSDANCCY